MALLDLRRVGVMLDRLLRPDQAADNAQQAASDARRTVRERASVERDVGKIVEERQV
jgi:hypothetical protein